MSLKLGKPKFERAVADATARWGVNLLQLKVIAGTLEQV